MTDVQREQFGGWRRLNAIRAKAFERRVSGRERQLTQTLCRKPISCLLKIEEDSSVCRIT